MVSVISLLVAAAGVAFGVYQWARQHGRLRVQVDEGQADIYVRLTVDAPAPVHVNGIAYQLKGRSRWRRMLHWLNPLCYNGHTRIRRRLKAMWRCSDSDLGMS